MEWRCLARINRQVVKGDGAVPPIRFGFPFRDRQLEIKEVGGRTRLIAGSEA